MKADIGLIGLAVMGENLALNMESKGFTVAVHTREPGKAVRFVTEGRGRGKKFIATNSYPELAENLTKPRKVLMMIKAGKPVDDTIELLLGSLEKGDIIIDGGNSNYNDTIRRAAYVESKGLLYIGSGVSGGEEGALKGPSIMPGGSREAYMQVKDILQAICAKVNGEPCCDYVGGDGAGHFVKMVHNGIEYGDMQLISEAYALLKNAAAYTTEETGDLFDKYNKGRLESYLIEITANILKYKENGEYTVDKILDCAGQKGTGKWAVISSMEEGIPLTLIGEAVYARALSSMLEERTLASEEFAEKLRGAELDKNTFAKDLENALYAAKLISYTQGFLLMKSAAKTYSWDLNYGKIALMWRGGCIIRSSFLGKIKDAFDKNADLPNLLLDSHFSGVMKECSSSLRKIVKTGIDYGIALPAFSAALSYFDGLRCLRSSANMLQAQRDYFGAHTYERTDKPRGVFFHTNWTGEGGDTTSNNYNA